MSGHPLWLRAFWAIHRALDRLSGGRLGAKVFGIPSLWLNLQAEPIATVRIGRRDHPVRAREATAAERERLWPRLVGLNPDYEKYQEQTTRPVPVFILEPRTAG